MTFLFPVKNQQQGTMEGRPSGPARVSSMFRRLMMVRVTPAERLVGDGKEREKDEKAAAAAGAEADVGSVALDKMVLSFMEESSAAVERPPRGRCSNCFNGNQDGISDDEDFGFLPSASFPAAPPAAAGDALELLKGLVQCASTAERNLLADASRVADRSGKGSGRKKADVRRAVADGLRGLGYDAAVCTARWDKTPSHPAAEHQYIDVVLVVGSGSSSSAAASAGDGVRLVVEVDFRKEFEVARPTKAYRAALQALPPLFVGTTDRLGAIVGVVAEAARQSLRKRGLHFPPWRKHEYMRAKWLSPYERSSGGGPDSTPPLPPPALELATPISAANFSGEFQLLFEETPKSGTAAAADDDIPGGEDDGADETKITVVVSPKPKPEDPGAASSSSKVSPPPPQPPQGKQKAVTGLAALLLLAS